MSDTNNDPDDAGKPAEQGEGGAAPSFTDAPNPYPQPPTVDPRMTHPAVSVTDEETGQTVIPDASQASQEEADTGISITGGQQQQQQPEEDAANEPEEGDDASVRD